MSCFIPALNHPCTRSRLPSRCRRFRCKDRPSLRTALDGGHGRGLHKPGLCLVLQHDGGGRGLRFSLEKYCRQVLLIANQALAMVKSLRRLGGPWQTGASGPTRSMKSLIDSSPASMIWKGLSYSLSMPRGTPQHSPWSFGTMKIWFTVANLGPM